MSDSTIAVSSKYTQDLSVQIVFFTLTCKWFLCFYFWAVIWSYIVDLFAALHELASASSRTLLKLASSVRALLKPYGDTLRRLERVFRCYIVCETKEDYKEGCLMVWANYMSPCNSIVGLYFKGTCDVISVTMATHKVHKSGL